MNTVIIRIAGRSHSMNLPLDYHCGLVVFKLVAGTAFTNVHCSIDALNTLASQFALTIINNTLHITDTSFIDLGYMQTCHGKMRDV
ncbi:hypothetical protein BLA29_007094 [Euroglyphus maynei]|uniref:Uncharacterized protein n=1 Tax=Euroglyphus maynei TaxID=6958 RepID=A0A1Y3AZC7_EURMA|nr:hypothetical protein BLA29_007094 [Euroglyphus maynei]